MVWKDASTSTESSSPSLLPRDLSTGPSTAGLTSASGASWTRRRPGAAARSAEDVIRDGYQAVLRLYCSVMFWGSVSAIPVLGFGSGSLALRGFTGLALSVAIVVYGYGVFRTRDEDAPELKVPRGVLLVLVLVAVALHYGLGFYPGLPFVVMLGIGVLLLTVAEPKREGLFVYVAGATAYGVSMSLVAAGVVPAQGLLAGEVDPMTMWISAIGMQIGLAVAHIFGRLMAAYSQEIVDRLSKAVRDAFRREALLREARADLQQAEALKPPGCSPSLSWMSTAWAI